VKEKAQQYKPLTLEAAKERHKALWGWLAETGSFKSDWPEWKSYKDLGSYIDAIDPIFGKILNGCYACDITRNKNTQKQWCMICPIAWPKGLPCQYKEQTPWNKWIRSALGSDERKRLGAIIRDMPWKDDVSND
jgi:hypothetical protein